jgi:DNA-binding GntR family transcriptional regulator
MPRTPIYQRITTDITEQISCGALRPGDQLPSMSQLQRQYGVSTQPVRSAMRTLQAQGLIEGHQGKGVFVAERLPLCPSHPFDAGHSAAAAPTVSRPP